MPVLRGRASCTLWVATEGRVGALSAQWKLAGKGASRRAGRACGLCARRRTAWPSTMAKAPAITAPAPHPVLLHVLLGGSPYLTASLQ